MYKAVVLSLSSECSEPLTSASDIHGITWGRQTNGVPSGVSGGGLTADTVVCMGESVCFFVFVALAWHRVLVLGTRLLVSLLFFSSF